MSLYYFTTHNLQLNKCYKRIKIFLIITSINDYIITYYGVKTKK